MNSLRQPAPHGRRCTATNRQGGRCGRSAIPGGTVCNHHGGKAPQVVAAAQERLQVEEAWRALARVQASRPSRPSWGETAADALLDG